ncbi:MAG: hypothetical protein ACP5VP_05840 [Candidatus Limnocylindrales bacterium]
MTMIRVSPLEVQVRCGWVDGRPRAIRLGRVDLPVLDVARVRQESAVYPASSGPRTRFQVVTETATFDLVYRHRDRRWIVEGLDPAGAVGLPARAMVPSAAAPRQVPLGAQEPVSGAGEQLRKRAAAFVRAA